MRYCPICARSYSHDVEVCDVDGAVLRESGTNQDALIGKIVRGRYRVIEKLGEGGMGTVYLAEQIAISRKVALKLLHPDYARDNEYVRRFRQEAKLAASLNHRNIITVFDFDQADDGSLYIVMEYVAGKSLSRLIQEGPMSVRRALRLAIQIGEGLSAAHAAGVIHRDIKPENIMVVGEEEIKLMDFGIARLSDTGAATRLTRSGMIMGTPTYMAPEQIEGGEVGQATDIYAFGIVLYEMLSGSVPFSAPTPGAILIKHLQETPASLRKIRKEIPSSLETVVKTALEKRPHQRQRTMNDVVEALAKAHREVWSEKTPVMGAFTAGRALSSISTWIRQLFQKAAPADRLPQNTVEGVAPRPRQDSELRVEARQVSVEPIITIAETTPVSITQQTDMRQEISEARDALTVEVNEPIPLPREQTVQPDEQTGFSETSVPAQTAIVYDTSETIAEAAIGTTTQPIEKPRPQSWRWPGLGLAAAVLLGIVGTLVYRNIGNKPPEDTRLPQEAPATTASAEKIAAAPQDLPTKAELQPETSAPKIPEAAEKTKITRNEKPTAKETRVPPPTPELKIPKPAKREGVAELKERPDARKAAPAPEPAPAKKVAPEEIKPAEKPKEPEPEKTRIAEPAKKDPETKLASIEKPALTPPEPPPAPVEARLLSLAIVSNKKDINVKERVLLTVKGKYSDGKENEIAAGVRWETSDANVAAVNSRGELEGRKEGKAEVTARYAGVVSAVYTFNIKGSSESQKPVEAGERLQDQRRRLLR